MYKLFISVSLLLEQNKGQESGAREAFELLARDPMTIYL
jgi:hypothetical protein